MGFLSEIVRAIETDDLFYLQIENRGKTLGLKTISISSSFFDDRKDTLITWLGMAGALINSRGTIIFIDPIITHGKTPELCETGHRLLVPFPILSKDVPKAAVAKVKVDSWLWQVDVRVEVLQFRA